MIKAREWLDGYQSYRVEFLKKRPNATNKDIRRAQLAYIRLIQKDAKESK